MQPGGQDNSPYLQTLMSAIAPSNEGGDTAIVVMLPPSLGRGQTHWYFSQPFAVARGIRLSCGTSGAGGYGGSVLVFPPGVDGVIQELSYLTLDQGEGSSDITGCGIASLGGGRAIATQGSTNLTSVHLKSYLSTPDWTFPASCGSAPGEHECHVGVGDGIAAIRYGQSDGRMVVAPGAYVTAANFAAATATLSSPILNNLVGNPDNVVIFDLPVSQKYTAQTTMGSNVITVTGGPPLMRPATNDPVDAFQFGTSVSAVHNAIVGTPTVRTGGSGYTGSSGTMTYTGPGCVYDGYSTPPVLNVTASGGADHRRRQRGGWG